MVRRILALVALALWASNASAAVYAENVQTSFSVTDGNGNPYTYSAGSTFGLAIWDGVIPFAPYCGPSLCLLAAYSGQMVSVPPRLSTYFPTLGDMLLANGLGGVTDAGVPPSSNCNTIPALDTLLGTTSSLNCFTPSAASRPTAVQRVNTSTGSGGTWAVSFNRTFISSSPIVIAAPINTSSAPMICNVAARSSTAASGNCWALQGVIPVLGVSLIPYTATSSGVAVLVVGSEPTQ